MIAPSGVAEAASLLCYFWSWERQRRGFVGLLSCHQGEQSLYRVEIPPAQVLAMCLAAGIPTLARA